MKEILNIHREEFYIDALQVFYGNLLFGSEQSFETLLYTPDKREEYLAVLNSEKIAAEQKLVVVRMHDDDEFIAGAIIKKLADSGVAVFMITITNGDGRPRDGLTKEEVTKRRRQEAVDVSLQLGAAAYFNLGYPDMEVGDKTTDIKRTLVPYLRMIDPTIVITLHRDDPNPDHRDGSRIVYDTLYRARNTFDIESAPYIPIAQEKPSLYYMDPQSLVDYKGDDNRPGMLVRVYPEESSFLRQAMLTYSTQYSSADDLWEFEARARERGKLWGFRRKYRAEGLTQELGGGFSSNNIIAEILGRKIVKKLRKHFHRRLRPVI